MFCLHFLFAILILVPIYTYVIYPLILKQLPAKTYIIDQEFRPFVSVIILAYNREDKIERKIENILKIEYPNNKIQLLIALDESKYQIVEDLNKYKQMKKFKTIKFIANKNNNILDKILSETRGEILILTDLNTMLNDKVVINIVRHFVDKRVGCVSGQLRNKVDGNLGIAGKSEGIYQRYENWIKINESKLGRLTGANRGIYGIRNGILNKMKPFIINDDFYISTCILQAGYDVILDTEAIAYEELNEDFQSQFNRHIRDGAGHYQSMVYFWRMLFPRKGWFVYVSHRLARWIVPFLIIVAYPINALLILNNLIMLIFFYAQTILYVALLLYYFLVIKEQKKIEGILAKLFLNIFYFFTVNLSFLLGFLKLICKGQKAVWQSQKW